jgi:hypothetical protein
MIKLLLLFLVPLGLAFQLRADDSAKRYVGRYEVEPVSIIPISTLDVTFANGTLWLKPSAIKKRKLRARSITEFVDEVEGGKYKFNLDEKGEVQSLTFEYEGENYTARKVVLPSPSVKGNTTFKLRGYPAANIIALAGSFNDWAPSQLIFAKESDIWVCRIELAPGKHTYKFIVDGDWVIDPTNPKTEEDEAGNVNSVLVIEKK